MKELISTFLINIFGHPHLRTDVWNRVWPQAHSIIMSWLTEETLEDFFNVLDITAGDQWQYRKDFWQAVLNRKVIKRAWVILGTKARNMASNLPSRARSYGSLNGASSDQSALLMEIGGFVVAEWSHQGKCRFWQSNSNHAPKFFQLDYLSTSLRAESYADFIHSGSEKFAWQGSIADFLKREMGITISFSEYAKGK